MSRSPVFYYHVKPVKLAPAKGLAGLNLVIWSWPPTSTVKTLYNDAGRTADRIVIPMVLLYIESRVRLISKEKEASSHTKSLLVIPILVGKT